MEICKNCEKITSPLRYDGTNKYCNECYGKKAVVRCAECSEIITSGVVHGHDYYHPRCFTCAACGKCLAKEQFLTRNNRKFCFSCFEKVFSEKCAKCNQVFTGMGDIFYIYFNNRPWHQECFYCDRCKYSLVGRLTVTMGDDIFCTNCASYM